MEGGVSGPRQKWETFGYFCRENCSDLMANHGIQELTSASGAGKLPAVPDGSKPVVFSQPLVFSN